MPFKQTYDDYDLPSVTDVTKNLRLAAAKIFGRK